MAKPKAPPAGLHRRGRELWRWLFKFQPEPHEMLQVLEACRIADRLEELDRTLRREGLSAENSKGEAVPHWALVESRLQVVALARVINSLRIPAGEAESWDGLTSSARARRAALARHYPGARRSA
ncbi:MAG: hypothetical protein ACRDQ2_08725 [Gaiellales bacterium]